MYKNASRMFAFAVLTLLVTSILGSAQDSKAPFLPIKCTSGTACKTNFVPVFASTGGSATVKDSIVKQGGGAINVAGAVNATKGGSASVNAVNGSNTQSVGLGAGAGVYGQLSTTGESATGVGFQNGGGGVWGDGGNDSNYAIIGTTDDKAAGIFQNNGPSYYTNFSFNFATGSTGFPWAAENGDGAGCNIDTVGDLTCTGAKNAAVPVEGGKRWVALSAVESPKNWFEDFGSAELRGGVATVHLDATFKQTVNSAVEYHVFLTPNGDCKGLYVHQKSSTSFEVRELGGGNSNVKFDYRITALRKNYEKIRFAEHREFPLRKDGKVFPPKE
jgi:hypothetical protein